MRLSTAALLAALSACRFDEGQAPAPLAPDCGAAEGELPALRLEPILTDIDRPVLIKSPPGDPRLFLVQQEGLLRIVEGGALQAEPFLDLVDRVQCCGEQGLLGLAFHPDYALNGRYFVYYTALAAGEPQVVDERSRDDPAFEKRLLEMEDHYSVHNGGSMEFGPDGMLYISTGDGGGGGDPDDNAQNPLSLKGKILRLDVDHGDPYAIPADGNLAGAAPEVWDMGLRNPWRMSFDACTGDLYVPDIGHHRWEEINVEAPGQGRKNYGWDLNEGAHCYTDTSDPPACLPPDLTPPALEYGHGDGCAVIGGYVYRGSAIPALRGRYLYGDNCNGRIWSFAWQGGRPADPVELTADLGSDDTALLYNLASFGQDARGEVYVIGYETRNVFQIVPE